MATTDQSAERSAKLKQLLKLARKRNQTILRPLLWIESPLRAQYQVCYTCLESVRKETERFIIPIRCGYPLTCPNCAWRNTRERFAEWYPAVSRMKDPHVVTLTQDACTLQDIVEVTNRTREIRPKMLRRIRGRGIKPYGLVKMEVGAPQSEHENSFNVHLHVLIDGAHCARAMQHAWLHLNPFALPGHQHITTPDKFADHLSKVGATVNGNELGGLVNYILKPPIDLRAAQRAPRALDALLNRWNGGNALVPFGGFRKVKKSKKAHQMDWINDGELYHFMYQVDEYVSRHGVILE